MPNQYEIDQVEVSLEALLAEPIFDLFAEPSRFIRAAYEHLKPLGLRLTDIQFEAPSDNVSEMHLHCLLFDRTTQLQFFLDRLVLRSQTRTVIRINDLQDLISASLATVTSQGAARFQSYTAVIATHGRVGNPPAETLARLATRVPEGFGILVAPAATYYFGADSGRLLTVLTFDLSDQASGGLFIRLQQMYDAQELELGEITPRLFQDYLKALSFLELSLDGEQ